MSKGNVPIKLINQRIAARIVIILVKTVRALKNISVLNVSQIYYFMIISAMKKIFALIKLINLILHVKIVIIIVLFVMVLYKTSVYNVKVPYSSIIILVMRLVQIKHFKFKTFVKIATILALIVKDLIFMIVLPVNKITYFIILLVLKKENAP